MSGWGHMGSPSTADVTQAQHVVVAQLTGVASQGQGLGEARGILSSTQARLKKSPSRAEPRLSSEMAQSLPARATVSQSRQTGKSTGGCEARCGG